MTKSLKTSAEGRKCMFQNCTHTLSIYNHEAYCHLHRDQMAHQQKPKILETVLPAVEMQAAL
ncbi:MAG: hypothetical protein Q7T18_01500 [Sedimentisphaerales bacterium]|nr:hypothetical protein [Sedimentisphaerales bacterium]